MLRTVVLGVTLSIVVGLLVRFAPLGLDTTATVTLGACVGAVLAMNLDGEPWQRLLAFVAGAAATWVSYAARAELLPDAPNGRAIAIFAVLLLVTALSAATFGRLPLWAGLLGVAGFSGSYEFTFLEQPEVFAAQSLVALTTLAFAVGAGYALTVVLAEVLPARVLEPRRHVVDVREQMESGPPSWRPGLEDEHPQVAREPQPAIRGPRVIDLPRDRHQEV